MLLYPKEYAEKIAKAKKQIAKKQMKNGAKLSGTKVEVDENATQKIESKGQEFFEAKAEEEKNAVDAVAKENATIVKESVSAVTDDANIAQSESGAKEKEDADVASCEIDINSIFKEFESGLNASKGQSTTKQDSYNADFWNGVKGCNAKQIALYKKSLANGVLNNKILANCVANKKALALVKVALSQKDVTRTC